MAVRTAWSASGIALWLFAQVPGFSGAVLPKAGTSAVLARGFRFDATRFGALPGVCTLSTGEKVKFPIASELLGAIEGHHGGLGGHDMTSPFVDDTEIYPEIDRFGPFDPDLGLLLAQDPMCLHLDFLGSICAYGQGEENVRADLSRFDLPAARSQFRRARGFDHVKRKSKRPGQAKGLTMAALELDRLVALRELFGLVPAKKGGTYRASARDEANLNGLIPWIYSARGNKGDAALLLVLLDVACACAWCVFACYVYGLKPAAEQSAAAAVSIALMLARFFQKRPYLILLGLIFYNMVQVGATLPKYTPWMNNQSLLCATFKVL